jgi:hypothetical protein
MFRDVDCGDEAVAAPGDVYNEPVAISPIAQRATQGGHMDRKVGRLHKYVGPNPIHQFLLARARLPRDTGLFPFNRRNCVGSRRNGPNETSFGAARTGLVGFTKDCLSVLWTVRFSSDPGSE